MKLKRLFTISISILLVTSCTQNEKPENVSQYVNPNIGSIHSRWFFYTPAAEPFGMAKLGASTNGSYGNASGWEAVGYEDNHNSIDGFPCMHEFQVGGITLMPVTGKFVTNPGKMDDPDNGYRSRFDKSDEIAQPGYYSVLLKDYNIKAELTATARVGFQRYTFPESQESHILLDIGNRWGESGAVKDSYIEMTDNQTIQGYVVTEPEYVKKYQAGASVPLYFYAKVNKEPQSVDVFYRDGEPKQGKSIQGKGAGMSLNYHTKTNDEITVKVGLSYTSIDNARLNLETEAADMSFDEALANTQQKWEKSLGRILVSGGTEDSRIKFYTGLYHALLGRGLCSDVNGAYPKNDGSIGQIELDSRGTPIHHHYNTDAIWGAYWNLTTLWSIAYPEYYNDWINSQLLVYKDAGWLGDGIAASKYVSGVGTNMVSIAIAGAYQSGIRGYDIETAYQACLKNELGWENRIAGAGKMDTKEFVERGYSPYVQGLSEIETGGSAFSASHTLEYSFSAYAVAQFAKSLGKMEDYKKLMKYSNGWQHLFNDDLKLIHPKDVNGNFLDNFDPLVSWRGFQEGNAVQYTFYVPQNPEGLINRIGKDVFNNRLDSIFTEARKSIFGGGKETFAFSGIQSPYNHGNQPSLHISWLFNFSGKPYLTQKWTRLICDEFYGTDGEHGYGYGQDEDQGQLGAWFVLAGMGLVDVQGGTPERPTYQIGSPLFDKVEIKLSPVNATGKSFVIETINNDSDNYYIQSAELNGKTLDNCWLYRDEFYKGGNLKLNMADTPNEEWGATVIPPVTK